MADLHTSLSESFRSIPSAAVPALLDCVLAATGKSPSSLFDYLLFDFSNLTKKHIDVDKKMSSEESAYLVSYLRGLCHLLKKIGGNSVSFECFMQKAFIPLMKMVRLYEREILTEIVDSLLEIVIQTNNWELIEATLVSFMLRSLAFSMDIHQNDNASVIKWSVEFQISIKPHELDTVSKNIPVLPLTLVCYILSCLLDAAVENCQALRGSSILSDVSYAETFCGHLLSDLCNIIIPMLAQSVEHRSCATGLLLPSLFKAFASKSSFKVCVQGESQNISRHYFFMKLWKCSRMLFSLGPIERRDAYGIISLYLSFFSCGDKFEVEVDDREEAFDIRVEKEFWNEIKKGLVDEEGLVRKQSLHILKKILLINDERKLNSKVSEKKSYQKGPVPHGMTKRDLWAAEEANSLGVEKVCSSDDIHLSKQQTWEAFILLYEMLEEYGTHLVEAAWNHQMLLLLHSSVRHGGFVNSDASSKIDVLGGNFGWLAILWERGLFHDNPHVRCLIMQSFLDVDWKNVENCSKLFPEDFVLSSFMQGLNDPVHHKDFGLKGVYSSKTIEGASKFLHQYSSLLSQRERISFMCKLASVAKQQALGRVGLMSLADCILAASESSTVFGADGHGIFKARSYTDSSPDMNGMKSQRAVPCGDEGDLIDGLRYLVETSKQHFNRNYRLRVCEKIVEASASVLFAHKISLEKLLHFIAALPRESTDVGGILRIKVKKWLAGYHEKYIATNISSCKVQLMQDLCDMARRFTSRHDFFSDEVHYDDGDLFAWSSECERWARVILLLVEEYEFEPLFMFIKEKGIRICQPNTQEDIPVKFLLLILSLVHELDIMQRKTREEIKRDITTNSKVKLHLHEMVNEAYLFLEKFADAFMDILVGLVSFAESSCSIFWTEVSVDSSLPGSVTGKLGGPSQRRLSSSLTTGVLQSIVSVRTIAVVSSWCTLLKKDDSLNFAYTFLWRFFHRVISSEKPDSETSAEIRVAAYEALSCVLISSVPEISSSPVNFIQKMNNSSHPVSNNLPILDSVVLKFLNHINSFLAGRQLARTRRAVLMNWKWLCLEALLAIPYHALENGFQLGHGSTFFSDDTVRFIFGDLVESLENAGENFILPMLRSTRLVLDLLTSGRLFVSSCCGVDSEMMWQLVRSSWILHLSCNKRRVAPIAALLSSVLHASVFRDEGMHVMADETPGPLKWFCEKILEEGVKSPRTIRLAALHLTGLWLANPSAIKYYMKELKLLTLYGSVAFDEDFEAELTENDDARTEVSLLAKIRDCEITEAYINTELYARVSVAVLFYKLAELAEMVGSEKETEDCRAALESGKLFLLELLDAVVNDKDLAKELYKKYSSIHRRKVRALQMICVLSRFVRVDIVQQVIQTLSVCLYRNNLPAVRQYMETCAIHVYLTFPFLVKEHLAPILSDYEMKTQALSSYVFIAANIILHAKLEDQSKHLEELLPPIIPLLTSHHHTLRGFAQLLVYQVFSKVLPALDSSVSISDILEKKCIGNLMSYLELNPDCARLRTSMEGYLDAFNPEKSVTPAGIFSNRVEDSEFECVSMSLIEQLMHFLNDVREELRSSMAKDDVTLKNESLKIAEIPDCTHLSADASQVLPALPANNVPSVDFQKKITLFKHEMMSSSASSLDQLDLRPLLDMEREDHLLEQTLQSRIAYMEQLNANRQQLVLVASLIDRIPNLAGLARTCEVFKASCLAISDASVMQDKQFQLISVTAEKWVPIIEVPVNSVKNFLERKKREGFSIMGLEQTANSISLDKYSFPQKTVIVLGREKEGIPADIIHVLDACIEIPQLGVVRSLNVHVSGAIAIWEYTRQQRLT